MVVDDDAFLVNLHDFFGGSQVRRMRNLLVEANVYGFGWKRDDK